MKISRLLTILLILCLFASFAIVACGDDDDDDDADDSGINDCEFQCLHDFIERTADCAHYRDSSIEYYDNFDWDGCRNVDSLRLCAKNCDECLSNQSTNDDGSWDEDSFCYDDPSLCLYNFIHRTCTAPDATSDCPEKRDSQFFSCSGFDRACIDNCSKGNYFYDNLVLDDMTYSDGTSIDVTWEYWGSCLADCLGWGEFDIDTSCSFEDYFSCLTDADAAYDECEKATDSLPSECPEEIEYIHCKYDKHKKYTDCAEQENCLLGIDRYSCLYECEKEYYECRLNEDCDESSECTEEKTKCISNC